MIGMPAYDGPCSKAFRIKQRAEHQCIEHSIKIQRIQKPYCRAPTDYLSTGRETYICTPGDSPRTGCFGSPRSCPKPKDSILRFSTGTFNR